MPHRRHLLLAPALLLIIAAPAPATAAVTYGPHVVNIGLSRTWFDGTGGTLASESVSSGPLSYGPNTPGGVETPTTAFPAIGLAAPGQPAWEVLGESRAILNQSGNTQTMRSEAHSVLIATVRTPATGTGRVSVLVTHSVDFQLTEPAPWQASLSTVLSSPVFPTLQVFRDPGASPTTLVNETLPVDDPFMSRSYSGVLAAGSYRVLMTFPLLVEVSADAPGTFGGVHSASAVFTVPAPGAAAGLLAASAALGRSRRRRVVGAL